MKNKNKLNFVFHFRSPENGKTADEMVKELVEDTVRKTVAKYERSVYN